jgi:hypothetical protein
MRFARIRLFGGVVLACSLALLVNLASCSKKGSTEPEDEEVDEMISLLLETGDSISVWSETMTYSAATSQAINFIETHTIVDSCGISQDYTIWIEFNDGTGGDIYPIREFVLRSGHTSDSKSRIAFSDRYGPRGRAIIYDVVAFLPFVWQHSAHLNQADTLAKILQQELDLTMEVTSFIDSTATVANFKYAFGTCGINYISSHGGLVCGLPCFLTGEKVTTTSKEIHQWDLTHRLLRCATVAGMKHSYFAITPAFVRLYFPHDSSYTADSITTRIVFNASCRSFADTLANAFLGPGVHAYCGFVGDRSARTECDLLSEIWRAMQDTVTLEQACDAAPSRIQTSPVPCTLKLNQAEAEGQIVFDRFIFELNSQQFHSPITVFASKSAAGLNITADARNSTQSMTGTYMLFTDGIALGAYPISETRGNMMMFADSASGRLYLADATHKAAEWGGDQTGGTITLTGVDLPPGLLVGKFTGILGWWDDANPLPHPPDDVISIENGRFKLVSKN